MTHSKFSTSTVVGSQYSVPWLAAQGPLAYSPTEPPLQDYFFQYGWLLPGIFDPLVNLRKHFYFGGQFKDQANFLFQFWERARKRQTAEIYCQPGLFSNAEIKAPIAAYHHIVEPRGEAGSLFMQHGSYQWTSNQEQPMIERGRICLYRGIGTARCFRYLAVEPQRLSGQNLEIWRKYLGVQATMLSDSVLSFNTIHDRTKRVETAHLRDGTWLADKIATGAGLDVHSSGLAKDLWATAQQGYSLHPVVAHRKFGPHYVALSTPLSNVRITTFFAGERKV